MKYQQRKIDRQNVQDILSLTPMQEGMLFYYLDHPDSLVYLEQLCLQLTGKIDVQLMEQAWCHVAQDNEMLRTVFRWEKLPKPMQVILKRYQPPIRTYNLADLEEERQAEQVRKIKAQDLQEGIDLTTEPFRVTLVQLNDQECIMLVSNHHILYDGWSTGVILKEFFQSYQSLALGRTLPIRQKNSFKAFVKWLDGQDQQAQERYWSQYLTGFDSKSSLPAGRVQQELLTAPVLESNIDRYQFKLDQNLTARLHQFVTTQRITSASLLYAVWGILLQRYNDAEDVIFGTTVSGRNGAIPGVEEMVGLFINTIPLRVGSPDQQSILQLLQNLDRELKVRSQYENVPLVDIKSSSELDPKESLFDSIVVIENYPLDQQLNETNQQLRVANYSIAESTNFDLTLAIQLDEEVELELIYDRQKVAGEMLPQVGEQFVNLLTGIMEQPEGLVQELKLLSPNEQEQILVEFNATQAEYPREKTLAQIFEEQVVAHPEETALIMGDESLTYQDLNQRANQLAHTLRGQGVQSETIVGILVERSFEMIVGIMAVLKAGGAYLPLNPNDPLERLQYVLEDSQAQLLLTQHSHGEEVEFAGQVWDLEDAKIYDQDGHNLELVRSAHDLAYIIYTSGSTGKPKGVAVEHQSVVNILTQLERDYPLGEEDTYLLKTTYTFDVSVTELFGWFMGAGRLALLPPGGEKEIQTIVQAMSQHQVTHVNFVPSMLNIFVDGIDVEDQRRLESLKYLLVAGEAFPQKLLSQCQAKLPGVQIENIYGPTETTIYVTRCSTGELPEDSKIPIGQPMQNVRAYVLDRHQRLLPVGAPGELCIGGECLARGYLNRPELTAEKFVADPFVPGEKMYRTGDLVRWLPNGMIDFLGRIDHQVKIRGFRIELGEIENRLHSFASVKDAVVVAREDSQGGQDLCAYVVTAETVGTEELRSYLGQHLPEYMIPSYFIQMEELPLTGSGKVDRKELPAPQGKIQLETEYVPPRNEWETKLIVIWKQVLEIDQIGVYDNFFELGGHSLKATRLSGLIHKEFDLAVPIKQIFKTPTVAGLGSYLQQATGSVYATIEPITEQEYYKTSPAQQRMFLVQQMDLLSTGYNMSAAFEVTGSLELIKVEETFSQLAQRHEILRTTFKVVDGEIVQQVQPKLDFALELIEEIPASLEAKLIQEESTESKQQVETQSALEETMAAFVRPFDLGTGPLFRVGVLQLDQDHSIFLFDMHHIISDGTSMGILVDEFTRLYAGQPLEQLRIQYKDYAEWQDGFLQSEQIKVQEEYWLERFSDELPVLNLPTDHPRSGVQDLAGEVVTGRFDSELTAGLQRLAQETGSTLYMVLLAGLNILLARYSAQEDIIVGSPIAGRDHVDLEQVMGMFINTLAMRNQPLGEQTFHGFLQQVKENALQAYEYQDYQFERLVDQLQLDRDLSRNPLFDVMFAMQNMESREVQVDQVTFTPHPLTIRKAKFDLTFLVQESGQELEWEVEYRASLFEQETVNRMIGHWKNILAGVVANPQILLSQVELLSIPEQELVLYGLNQTAREYPAERGIHQLFVEQVEQHPDQVAVVCQERRLTYRELNREADRLAELLRAKGVRAESIVGIMVERSIEMIVGVVAILKAGGAYLPIDLEYPKERIRFMLEDCAVQVLLTQGMSAGEIGYEVEEIDLSDVAEDQKLAEAKLQSNPEEETESWARRLAYIIYTSGSTGNPKGVMVEHQNVVRLVKNTNFVDFVPGTKLLQTGTLAFDASTFEVWGALLNGLELHLASREFILNREKLEEYLISNQIGTMFLTTSLFNLFADQGPEMFRDVTYLLAGGEAISPKHVQQVQRACENVQIINGYGPTENTTFSTTYLVEEKGMSDIPIGKPIANSTAYILDRYDHLAPVGVYGELCAGGDGVARGYLNDPVLTAEKFVEHPSLPGERIYRTGDLARWLPDGNIQYLGRVDHQVKIRGFRIELGEIEKSLLESTLIQEAVVVADQDEQGNKYLTAYLVAEPDETFAIRQIREYLVAKMPDYMIPAYFVQLDQLPLNTNGKVDRKALPTPEGQAYTGGQYVAPGNELETQLVGIWQEVLGTDQPIGITDNFFEIGGHSLRATVLVGKIHQSLEVEVPLSQVFATPTIQGLGVYIQGVTKTAYSEIGKAPEQADYPVSSAQKRIYLLQQFDLTSTGYNIPGVLAVEGELELHRVEEAIAQLIQRHETLRTSFETRDGEIVQKIHSAVEFAVEYIDQRDADLTEEQALVTQTVAEFVRPFELSQAPLFRVGLLQLAATRWMLMFDLHHIISDGVSMGILVREFGQLYQGQELEMLEIQYKDVAVWQREQNHSELMQSQEEYWLQQFADQVPVLNLPTDRPRPAVQRLEGDTIQFTLDQELSQKLRELAQQTGSTLYMVLLSAVNILLAKYSGQDDIVVGSPIAGRPHPDLEKIIGVFVNTLAMRNQPEGQLSYVAFLEEVRSNALVAYEHQDYQFEELVDQLNVQRQMGRNPLFDVMFVMQNMELGELTLPGVKFSPYDYLNQTAKFDLTIAGSEVAEGILFNFEYSSHLFTAETVRRMITHYTNILSEITDDPSVELAQIDLMTADEKVRVLYELNDTQAAYPEEKTIHQLFEEQVEQTLERVALTFAGEELTYQQLNRQANQLARRLRQLGVQPDSLVGIVTERSVEMVVGILAILKSGGAYLPIDPAYPEDRIQYTLEDSQAQFLLTQEALVSELGFTGEVLCLDQSDLYQGDATNLEQINQPDDLAYVIYTSGTTGRPKGVMIEHRNVVRLIFNEKFQFDFSEKDVWTMFHSFCFDFSVWEMYGALLYGGRLVVVPRIVAQNPAEYLQLLKEEQVTVLNQTPTAFYNLIKEELLVQEAELMLRYIIFGGEALKPAMLREWRVKYQVTRLINMYGITETTVHVTYKEITETEIELGLSNIGGPIPTLTTYIMDQHLQIQPIGVPGELCVGGAGVARGYLNKPELTAEKFVANPYQPEEKLYRSGDLVKMLATGEMEYLGRIDHQVKIRGFRIELGEIESQLLKHIEISEVAVLAKEDDRGDKYLVAYLVADRELTIPELREHLAQQLPDYMIPAYFHQLASMPLTANGKLDRKGLPEIDQSLQAKVEYQAPQTELEAKLATIWSDVLGVEQVGIQNGFFELGGHSLKATLLAGKISKTLDVEVPLSVIFSRPTIAEQARYIEEQMETRYESIEVAPAREFYPTTSAQKRMYLLQQLDVTSTGYNMPFILEVQGKIDLEQVEKVFNQLVERHQILRTAFVTQDDQIVQRIATGVEVKVEVVESRVQSEEGPQQIMSGLIRPFDLGQVPLIRIGYIRTAPDHGYLVFDLHHIISDGVSLAVLVGEFTSLYQGEELAKLRVQYKDYADWVARQDKEAGEGLSKQAEYWQSQLAQPLPVLELPTDYPRPAKRSFAGGQFTFTVDQELTEELQRLAQRTGSTMFMVLLAAINIWLAKYSGQDDLIIGSPIAGRPHPDLEDMLGMFVNTLPMRNQPTGEKTVLEFLAEVRANGLAAYEHQEYPFEQLVEDLALTRDLSRNPVFDVSFTLQNMEQQEIRLPELQFTPYPLELGSTKFDLALAASEVEEQIEFQLQYSTALFSGETMARMAVHLQQILEQMTAQPELTIGDLEMLTAEEREWLIDGLNATVQEYPAEATVTQLFHSHVQEQPEHPAVVYGTGELTYRELNEQSNRLARLLREKGVRPDQFVGLVTERSLEMVVGIMAILKAGAAYLPINPTYPQERIRYMLEDSGSSVVLTQKHLVEKMPFAGEILALDDPTGLENALGEMATTDLDCINSAQDLAYLIYTSGSTGEPKGVMVSHRSLNNFIYSYYQKFDQQIGQRDRALSIANISFDASVSEIFMPLVLGATLVLNDAETVLDAKQLAQVMIEQQITISYIPPTLLTDLEPLLRAKQDQLRLDKIMTGVEPIQDLLLEKYQTLHPKMQILNGYGPTEATIVATSYKYGQREPVGQIVPIGSPLANTQVYILNQQHRPVPVGVVGEICIAGAGLARGYLNQEELTAAKFVVNPFIPGSRMYKTGDLAKRLPDGEIEFVGRRDHQVKIRGYRIELGEIQTQLLKYPEVKEVVVIDGKDQEGVKYLCAYLVAEVELTAGELREYLVKILPEYMVPTYFVQIDQIPLTANGKTDRRALPEPTENLLLGQEYVAPITPVEEKLAQIWQQVLGVSQIGIDDQYFELGGHSLNATTLVAQINKEFGVQMPLSELFQRPTIRELAKYLETLEKSTYLSIQPVATRDYYPTSSAQRRLYLQSEFEGESISYNMPGAVILEGRLDQQRLEQAFAELVERHETLRTSFHMRDGQVVQKVHPKVDFQVVCHSVALAQIKRVQTDFLRPFDLSQAPLLRVELVQMAQEKHLLLFDLHHIISDGVSMQQLIQEFFQLYQGEELPELRVQYKDFAVWQNQFLTTDAMAEQEQYWLDTFAGEIPVLNLPTDYLRPTVQSFRGDHLEFVLGEAETARVREVASKTGSTMYMVLLAAYNLLLYKYTGQEEIIVGTPIAGRNHADLQQIIGMFVNMLALKNSPKGSLSVENFLHQVKEQTLAAYDHQDYQFEELVEKLNLRRDLSRNPIFDLVFSLQQAQDDQLEADGLRVLPYEVEYQVAKFDLTLEAVEGPDQVQFHLEYCVDLFKRETMERFATHFLQVVEQMSADLDLTLAEVEILSPQEKERLLVEFNDTSLKYPEEQTLHQLFSRQVAESPEEIAVVDGAIRLTYGELNARANLLAHTLRQHGLQRDEVIGIMARRSSDYLVGIMSILKAGGAYLPIDPDYPAERINYMVEDSQTRIILTDQADAEERVSFNGQLVQLQDEQNYTGDGSDLESISTARDLAYVMYTSGSTGKPKGVMIEHRSVVSLSAYYNQLFALDQGRRFVHLSNVSFDTSVVEIFPPLIYGATVYVIDKELTLNREAFLEYVREHQIQIAQFVPMLLKEILLGGEKPASLEYIIVGGDKLDDALKDQILDLGYRLTNHYGPTESTVDALVAKCTQGVGTIGQPIANTQVYILDQDGQPTPVGVPGELCVSGVGLARGYLNRPQLTAEKFVPNPFVPGERMYRTGDLASWQDDGTVTFLGRLDHQVKIRGYRIELGEIEAQLLEYPGITDAVVLDRMDQQENKYLCAYFVAEGELTVAEIREKLARELPEYMIPTRFMQLDQMPLNSNGKVDRTALPEPSVSLDLGRTVATPTTELESKLVTIWEEVLGMEGIGINHNFFEIGVPSFPSLPFLAKIHQEFRVEVSLAQVFKSPTIKELTRYIAVTEESIYSAIQPITGQRYYPVSSAQKRLYLLTQFKNGATNITYNMPGALWIDGRLDQKRFTAAFQQLVERHETLRTSFGIVEGEIVQQVHPELEFEIDDLESNEEEVSQVANQFIRPFDLSQAPLLRVALIKVTPERQLLLFDMHHIISDGISLEILINEFIGLYQGMHLPELRIQYKDFAHWQNDFLKTERLAAQEEYWLQTFADEIPQLEMPTDYPRPAEPDFRGDCVEFVLEQELTEKLNQLCLKTGATTFMTLLAAYNVLLFKYTRQRDIVVGSPIAGRPHVDLQGVIGMFVNTLALRNYPMEDQSFSEFLRRVKENALQAFANQDYQFERLVQRLGIQQEQGRNPLFDTLFLMQNTDGAELELDGLTFTPHTFEQMITKFDLTLSAEEKDGQIQLVFEYATQLFNRETMEELAQHFIRILEQILADPQILLLEISLFDQPVGLEAEPESSDEIEADFDF